MTASTISEPDTLHALRWSDVAELASASGFPCVTLVLPTTPSPHHMSAHDRAELASLIDRAQRMLRDAGVLSREHLVSALREMAATASSQPTVRGLVLCASTAVQRRFTVPQTVQRRVVLESTFATRELIAALHRTPPHLLATLHPGCCHIYRVQGSSATPVATLHAPAPTAGFDLDDPADLDEQARATTNTFLAEADLELGQQRALFPSPLVLAGTPRLVDRFARRSRNCHRLAGLIDTAHAQTLPELLRKSAIHLERYLRSRQAEALTLVQRTADQHPERLAVGIEGAWHTARRSRPLMLVVEESFSVPGGIGGVPLSPADYRETDPRHLHDLVDDLVEEVIRRGGQVALVEDGALRDLGRVALVLPSRDRS
jgi:hypothetical protein